MKLCYILVKLLSRQFYCFPMAFIAYFILLHTSYVGYSKAFSQDLTRVKIASDMSRAPGPVRKMHARILRAAQTGKIDTLLPVLESNELTPIVSFSSLLKPLDYWKSVSKNGDGREILAHMVKVKQLPYAILDAGSEKERYVWPYLAEIPVDSLSKKQVKDLLSLVTAEEYELMKKQGKYLFYRSIIGQDGTWHMFAK